MLCIQQSPHSNARHGIAMSGPVTFENQPENETCNARKWKTHRKGVNVIGNKRSRVGLLYSRLMLGILECCLLLGLPLLSMAKETGDGGGAGGSSLMKL